LAFETSAEAERRRSNKSANIAGAELPPEQRVGVHIAKVITRKKTDATFSAAFHLETCFL
jgi:hypothetical protein